MTVYINTYKECHHPYWCHGCGKSQLRKEGKGSRKIATLYSRLKFSFQGAVSSRWWLNSVSDDFVDEISIYRKEKEQQSNLNKIGAAA